MSKRLLTVTNQAPAAGILGGRAFEVEQSNQGSTLSKRGAAARGPSYSAPWRDRTIRKRQTIVSPSTRFARSRAGERRQKVPFGESQDDDSQKISRLRCLKPASGSEIPGPLPGSPATCPKGWYFFPWSSTHGKKIRALIIVAASRILFFRPGSAGASPALRRGCGQDARAPRKADTTIETFCLSPQSGGSASWQER